MISVAEVRPGLVFKIVSANIAQDGTISVDYKVSDPKGLPLDTAGITTPGAVRPAPIGLSSVASSRLAAGSVCHAASSSPGGRLATHGAENAEGEHREHE